MRGIKTAALLAAGASAATAASSAQAVAPVPGQATITSFAVSQKGVGPPGPRYYVRVTIKLRVCGQTNRARIQVSQTKTLGGDASPVVARKRSQTVRRQSKDCTLHTIRYRLAQKFFGVGKYTVAVKARTTSTTFSAVRSKSFETTD